MSCHLLKRYLGTGHWWPWSRRVRHMILQHLEDDPELDLSVAMSCDVWCGAISFCQEHLVSLRRNVPTNPASKRFLPTFLLLCFLRPFAETSQVGLLPRDDPGRRCFCCEWGCGIRGAANTQLAANSPRGSYVLGNGARPTTASLSSFNVCEAFGCRELKWCQTMEIYN